MRKISNLTNNQETAYKRQMIFFCPLIYKVFLIIILNVDEMQKNKHIYTILLGNFCHLSGKEFIHILIFYTIISSLLIYTKEIIRDSHKYLFRVMFVLYRVFILKIS